jgi:hypothetical protein
MDITADTLLNQVSTIFLNKLDKQNIDPSVLKGFIDSLLKKYTFKDTGPIKQQTQTLAKEKQSNSTRSLVDDIKKAYRELLKDNTYISDYKQFLKKVSATSLIEEKNLPLNKHNKSQDTITNNTVTNNTYNEQTEAPGKLDLIKEETKPQIVLLGGITEQGYKSLGDRLPKILKGIFTKQPLQEKPTSGGLGLLGGGIALLLGGLAALVTGLMTDGPFKGILKILSKAGLTGGIKLLQTAAKFFIDGLKQVIMAPVNILKSVAKSIGKIFGKEAYKTILKPLRGLTGIFTKMLGGLVKFVTPLLKKLPLIGTIISWGFAFSRFKSGDVVGGIIDVLSGIASIFPGVGTAIAIGLDVLNAFLDVKSGGANEKASQKKTGLLKEWALGLGKLLYDGIKYIPIIGPLLQAVEDMVNGKWLDATYNLVRAIPGVGIVLDVLNYFTEGKSGETIKSGLSQTGEKIGEWMSWVRENIWEKITNFITGIFDGVKDWWNNLSWDPRSWVGMAPELPKEPSPGSQPSVPTTLKNQSSTATTSQPVPLAKGGIVTQPVNAIVGEAGPEAVMPLEKYLNPKDLTLNNATLEQIAANTGDTNSSLNGLTDAIIKMIGAFNQKMTSQNNTTIVNSTGGSKEPTSAAMVANFNIDPIRRVRSQFAV